MAVATVGNADFRGYLNSLAKAGDQRAQLAISGYDGYGYVDNNGNINRGLLNELNQAAPGDSTSDEQYQQSQVDYLTNAFAKYKAGTSGGGGGGSTGTAQDKLDEQAYWNDQLANADAQIGRLDTQERVGNQNIDSSYQSAYDRLVGDKATTERDYNTKKDQTIQDNVVAKNNIDTSVRNRNTGLQRLLGAKGAGNSSAATVLAPYAAAKEGNDQRQQVQTAYGRNVQGLDTAWGDYGKDWDTSVGDLGAQRDTNRNTLRSGIATTRANLLQTKGDAAVNAAQAGGANYTTARNARTPYTARINELLGQIDQLGATPTFTPKTVAYKAPELASYDYTRPQAVAVGSDVTPGQAQGAGAYYTLLNGQKKKEQALA